VYFEILAFVHVCDENLSLKVHHLKYGSLMAEIFHLGVKRTMGAYSTDLKKFILNLLYTGVKYSFPKNKPQNASRCDTFQ
jgi:hypothetical protein